MAPTTAEDPKARRRRLLQLTHDQAFREGEFKLASGKVSDCYFDGKQVTFDPEGATLFAEAILDKIAAVDLDAIAGPESGALSIVAAVIVEGRRRGKSIRGGYTRKEPKGHGLRAMVEGRVRAGDRVVVVEDTITTGGSTLKSIRALEAFGARIVKVVCLVDREEGAAETLAGYEVDPVFTKAEVRAYAQGTP
ncbi:MAG: orotate phosphoribosyltransferase [Myxococcales bacterium]|nr:orotate phosphoribosyltransferase [Myxococcales bacterium]